MAELRPRSFRIDEETAEKFKKICLEAGLNQQDALAKLIESYELQAGKAVLTEKRDEIEVFERYTSILIQKYMSALEDNQNIKETVRTEFSAQLRSKDELISDLQQQKKEAEEAKQQAAADAKKATKEADQLRKQLEETQKRCKELEEDKEAFSGRNKDLEADRSRLEAEVKALKEDQTAAGKKALEDLREKMEIDKERAVLDAEMRLQKEHKEEIRELNQKYAELIAAKLRKPEEVKKDE